MKSFVQTILTLILLSLYTPLIAQRVIKSIDLGFSKKIRSLVFSPNGQYFAAATSDATMIYDSNGNLVKGIPFESNAILFSPHNNGLLTGGYAGRLALWDFKGTVLNTYKNEELRASISALAISENGGQIIAGYSNGNLKTWTIDAGKTSLPVSANPQTQDTGKVMNYKLLPISTLLPDRDILDIALFRDGQMLTCTKGAKELTQTLAGKQAQLIKHPFSNILKAIPSPTQKSIVTGHDDGKIYVWDLQGKLETTIYSHISPIVALKYSDDGKKLLSASNDGRVVVYDSQGKVLQSFMTNRTQGTHTTAAVFSSDGSQAIIGDDFGGIQVWDLQKAGMQRLQVNDREILTLTFSPDNRTFLTTSRYNSITLWDTARKDIKSLNTQIQSSEMPAAAFDPSGNRILTGSNEGLVLEWDKQGNLMQAFRGYSASLLFVAFHPSLPWVIGMGKDNQVVIWNRETAQIIKKFNAHPVKAATATLAPDGQSILVGGEDGSCMLWNLEGVLLKKLTGSKNRITKTRITPDGKSMVTLDMLGAIRIWNNEGQLLHTIDTVKYVANAIAFLPDSRSLICCYRNFIRTIDLDGKTISTVKSEREFAAHTEISADGKAIITGDWKEVFWLNESGKLIKTYSGHTHAAEFTGFSPEGTPITGSVREWILWDSISPITIVDPLNGRGIMSNIETSPDRTKILVVNYSEYPRAGIYDLHGKLVKTIKTSMFGNVIHFAADGKNLINIYKRYVIVVSIDKDSMTTVLVDTTEQFTCGALSANSAQIVTGHADGKLRLWDNKGKVIAEFSGHKAGVRAVVFSQDGQYILSGGEDGKVILREISGKVLQTLEGPMLMEQIGFAPDGKSIVAAGVGAPGSFVRHWNLKGELINTYRLRDYNSVRSLSFSPDGRKILVGGGTQFGATLFELKPVP